jgi:hypothetical protein
MSSMFILGGTRSFDFRVLVDGIPVTGIAQSFLSVYFTRDGIACTDPLTFVEHVGHGGGRYTLSYFPSVSGHDYIDISYFVAGDPAADPAIPDKYFYAHESMDIVTQQQLVGASTAIVLTQNTPTANALRVTVPNPQTYTLYVYRSSDWQTGATATVNAVASTQLDTSGNWITGALTVISGTYHVIIRDGSGAVTVIKAYLQV